MTDQEFLAAFEDGSLPRDRWTHRAHVKVAYLYTSSMPLPKAIAKIRSRIQAYNVANRRSQPTNPESDGNGYHETITIAFMRLVHAADQRTGPHCCAEAFCESHPELLEKAVLQTFYSLEYLMSARARSTFVEPDLAPLPDDTPRQ